MRFFKKIKRSNLTYILSELVLLFIGINLAIWFNNWNTSKKINEAKAVAIEKIIDEIENNQLEVETVLQNNYIVLNAYEDFKNLYSGNTSVVKADAIKMQTLTNKYPGFFTVKDSTLIDEGQYLYEGSSRINLEIPTLTEIAWETTVTKNISVEFSYDCLYELESVYNLQRRVQVEIDKSADALQKGDIESLMVILDFLNQLGNDLKQDYEALKEHIKNCS
ncbi:hypothetical protein SAMN04490243_0768 [Robiginitalea myxolifaciens]|uniref:Uncharacterized protein n=1 Tax=Robiginitalea myxolifaciens TaxID=400055 RepID=A0A1I6FVU5_9FLAO|nr:hypothetical protein [Robiginitalea myxolifaciens]SFR34028.1 hypothetical protein SAMN04490243_0768 [Robiginitalea myxolifaciens]